MSSHSYTELSAHLLAATPMAHWAEHVSVFERLLLEPARPVGGALIASDRPGFGIEWNEDAIRHSQVN